MRFYNVAVATQARTRRGRGSITRRALSIVLSLVMLTGLASAAPDATSIRTQIAGMQLGANMELHLKNKQVLRGARGAVSDAGFTFVEARTGERQIAYDDVASVKQVIKKSHTLRNVLIVTVAAVAILTIVASAHGGPPKGTPAQKIGFIVFFF